MPNPYASQTPSADSQAGTSSQLSQLRYRQFLNVGRGLNRFKNVTHAGTCSAVERPIARSCPGSTYRLRRLDEIRSL
jgi:hypothetical protein